jgi:NOL1/NOP2/sun family putative RNA methylase
MAPRRNGHLTPAAQPPAEFLSRMQGLLGNEYPAFAACYTNPPADGLRVNTLKISEKDFQCFFKQYIASLGENVAYQEVGWCVAGWSFTDNPPLGKHPYHSAGLYYLQEPSAMAVAQILSPQPGERVLDLAAAPGGKSTHLISLMHNQGLLVANEIHPQRVWELAKNLERWGARNTAITNETPERLAFHFGAFFDRVLVDAPCSGEGMFRKSEAARRDWSPQLVQSCALRQGGILEEAVKLVRPGGWLACSTCTFNPAENEAVIARLLDNHPELGLVETPDQAGFSPGRPDWARDSEARPELARAVRIWPHRSPGEGHFVALLQKSAEISQLNAGKVGAKSRKIEPTIGKYLDDFYHTALDISFNPGRLMQAGSYLYYLSENLPDLRGLKVIHPGWWLGTLKKDRFEPSHALALGLRAGQARHVLDFSAQSDQIEAYLRGETLSYPGENGWILVCVDGYPLGWGKRRNGVVKNYYPRGLRRY